MTQTLNAQLVGSVVLGKTDLVRATMLDLDVRCAEYRKRFGKLPFPIRDDLESIKKFAERCLEEPDAPR